MAQSLVQLYVHIIFSTDQRRPFLADPVFRSRVHAYLVGICKNFDSPSLQIGGVADHVHILCRFSKSQELADMIRDMKRDSTVWIKKENPNLRDFHWQKGYGAFSVSPGHVEALTQYIANQEQHHKKESYQDEFRRICKKYGVALDERYVWE